MTTLMEEEPFAAVVKDEFIETTCARCFCKKIEILDVKSGRCAACNVFYYCSKECQTADWEDHKPECLYLRENKNKSLPTGCIRLLARIFRRMRSEPDYKAFNGRTFDSFADHSELLKKNDHFIRTANEISAALDKFMGSWEAPDYDTALSLFSKVATHEVAIRDGTLEFQMRGIGVYLGLSAIQHSCRPNAFVITKGSTLVLKTTDPNIRYSDKLKIDLMSNSLFRDTRSRRERFLTDCHCEECEDVEKDKERTSGRPPCCPEGIFYTTEPRCSVCNAEIHKSSVEEAESWMDLLRQVISDCERCVQTDRRSLIPRLMEFVEKSKLHLSNENTYYVGVADFVYSELMFDDLPNAIKHLEICLPHARKRPYCHYSVVLLCRRYQLYDRAAKPFDEISHALAEAIRSVVVVYGRDHRLTEHLVAKKKALKKRASKMRQKSGCSKELKSPL